MPSISAADKAIAKAAAQAFGGRPRVARFWDDDHASSVDILTCEDRPQEGVVSYSTVGLSGWPLFKGEEEYGARLEIVGAFGSAFKGFENALSTAAFCIINSKWFCCPGVIFPDVLAMYDCSPTMRHFLFVPPFLWEDHLNTLDLDGRKVAWLLAVPISEDERAFAEANGSEKLEELFADRQIGIFGRLSVCGAQEASRIASCRKRHRQSAESKLIVSDLLSGRLSVLPDYSRSMARISQEMAEPRWPPAGGVLQCNT